MKRGRRLACVVVVLAAVWGTWPAAQEGSRSGRIRGVVTAADSGQPIRLAAVTVTSSVKGMTKTTLTDASGRYGFAELPAGRYTIAVNKAGFVPLSFGQHAYGGEARRIELADGQRFDEGHIKLPRGSVLSGRVFDEAGDPLVDASVQVFRAQYAQGVRRLARVRSGMTNDLGQFRIYGLAAGTYYVSAALSRGQMYLADLLRTLDGPLQNVTFSFSDPASAGFAPTFFPGVVSPVDARPIPLEAGQETANVDFVLQWVRLARVTGRVVDSSGRPSTKGSVSLTSPRPDLGVLGLVTTRTDGEGAFSFAGVVPSEYRIRVRTAGDAHELATIPLAVVAGTDIEGLTITTSRGYTLSGRLVVEGGELLSFDLPSLSVMAVDPFGEAGPGDMRAPGASLEPDSSFFQIRGLAGTRFIRIERLRDTWTLKAVRAGGVDIIDSGVDVVSDISDVEVVVTRATRLNGTVVDPRGLSVSDRTVVVFPEDTRRWAAVMNRYLASARTGPGGLFSIAGLPPGAYLAAVIDPANEGDWMAPENLQRLQSIATKFTLAEAEHKPLRLVLR